MKQQSISKILNSQQEDDSLSKEKHLATKTASAILLDSDSDLWKWPQNQQTCVYGTMYKLQKMV